MRGAPKLKVLVLHGWGQNGALGQEALAPLADTLLQESGALLVFATAPHVLPAKATVLIGGQPHFVDNFASGRRPHGWFLYTDGADADTAAVPRDFYHAALPYRGWQASVASIAECWAAQGPFDGVMGFSQGAAMAHLLTSLRCASCSSSTRPYPWLLSLRFAIFAGGFPSRLSPAPSPTRSLSLPTLHLSGAQDRDVPPALHDELAACFVDSTLHRHPHGHVVPTADSDVKTIKQFLARFPRAQ